MFPTGIPSEVPIVLACVVLYILSYVVYTRRTRDLEILSNRPTLEQEVTGEAGPDATKAPKGKKGPDGQLKMLKETQRKEYETSLKNFLISQDRFQMGLFALFWVCSLFLIGNIVWFKTAELEWLRATLIVVGFGAISYLYGFFRYFFTIGDNLKNTWEKMTDFLVVTIPETSEEKLAQEDIRNGHDYYLILNIPETASDQLVQTALKNADDLYIQKPEKTCTNNDLAGIRVILDRAKVFLTDPIKRKIYNGIRHGFNQIPKRKDYSSTCRWKTQLNILV
jgi:hypothetical protein